MFDQDTLNSAWGNASATKSQAQPTAKKGPGGIKGFLVNNLPGIASGVGSVAGSFLAPGVGTVGGGAAGGALGEFLKRKITGQKEDIGQIAQQGIEGGVLSSIGGVGKGITKGAQALTKLGTNTAEKEVAATATAKTGNNFMKNLVTQGQAAQGRVAGISAGSKVAGKELVPQDTERMLGTLKNEGIDTSNANNMLRDVVDKKNTYGQQIADHFKANDTPLHPEDTKVIADNYLKGITTTDPGVLKQAQIISDDLQKNVKSTKDLWDFRKGLDSKIPDSKFVDEATSNKVTALKSARDYISNELGQVPGMKNYHDLSEIQPFASAEAKRLNNPSGGIVGRVLSSGPAQKAENLAGKTAEKVGKLGGGTPPPIPPPTDIPESVLQSASAATKDVPQAVDTMALGKQNILQKVIGAGANPVANPGQTAKAVGVQELGRGAGVPAALTSQAKSTQNNSDQSINSADTLLQASSNSPQQNSDPYDPSNAQANVQAILKQGGTQKDISDYLSNVESYQKLTTPASASLNSTQQQQANNANSGLQDIQNLASMLQKDPSLTLKSSLPGGGVVQRLTGTTDYEAAKNNIVDVISRLRSGAAISAGEEKLYQSLLPADGDTSESANSKLQRLSTLLSSFANPGGQ